MKRFFKWLFTLLGVLILIQLGFYWHATTSPQWEYAKRALANQSANYDLRYCIDLPEGSRKDFSKTSWKPLPCINTATSLYNDRCWS